MVKIGNKPQKNLGMERERFGYYRHSPPVICAAITSRMNKAKLPTHISLDMKKYDISKDSVILLEQIRTIDKSRLREKVCHLDQDILQKIDQALCISLAIEEKTHQ